MKNTRIVLSIALLLCFLPLWAAPKQSKVVTLNWLENEPVISSGVSWGVPWPKGEVLKNQTFVLNTSDGKELPLQSWSLAYWPDGSIKWSGFATVRGNFNRKSNTQSGSRNTNRKQNQAQWQRISCL